MESSYLKLTALVIGIASLLFLIASFLPFNKVFMASGAEERMAILNEMKSMWNIGSVTFALASVATVAGLGMLFFGLKENSNILLNYTSILLLGAGAIFLCWHQVENISDPEGFAKGTNTPVIFIIYSVLTQVGLVLAGIILLNSFVTNWLGWMFVIGSGALLILLIIFKDMPPMFYYIFTLILSIMLLVKYV